MTNDDRPPPTLAQLAETAAHAIQAAIQQPTPGNLTAPQTHQVLSELAVLADQLPALLDQLSASLEARHNLGGLRLNSYGLDRYVTPGGAIASTQVALTDAVTAALALARHLDEVLVITTTIVDTDAVDHD